MAENQFFTPLSDFVFKIIFGDRRNGPILKAFLSAALKIPEAELGELTLIDPHLKRESETDKLGVLDVKVHTVKGMVINVEMQVKTTPDLRKRIVSYAARLLTGQLKRGGEYQEIEKVVSIVICDEVLIKEEADYYNSYSLLNRKTGREFLDLLEIDVLDVRKLPAGGDGEKLYRWAEFFKAKGREEYRMMAEQMTEPAIKEAAMRVLELNDDERMMLLAESRDKFMWDLSSRERASFAEGIEKGKAEGITEAKAEAARSMKADNIPVEKISRYTGLSPEQIDRLEP
jgi:predicted transposase/invertase (TIGR01784 family)